MTSVANDEMNDEQITEFIADPAKIESHEQVLEIIGTLDSEIASIQIQIDAASFESMGRPLTTEREAWLRRASYAAAMRRNERHRVMQRDKEIRRIKGPAQQAPKHTPEEKILKQQRLMEEASARRATKQAEGLKSQLALQDVAQRRRELEARSSFNHRFVMEAKRQLSAEAYGAISCRAMEEME